MKPAVGYLLVKHLLLVLFGLFSLFPFVWMVLSSFKVQDEIFQDTFHLLPQTWTLENYQIVFTQAPIWRYFFNGAWVCLLILLGQLLVILPAAYAFARLEFRGRDVLFKLVLTALVIPSYVTVLPNFLLLANLKLLDTYAALTLPFLGSAFGIFMLRQHFRQLPGEVLEAARMDGASPMQTLWHVILPLTRPAVAAFAIFSVVAHWNDFFWPLVVLRSAEMYTPPAGIVYFAQAEGTRGWGVVMAAATVVVFPLVLVFLLARKQFIEGLAGSAVKG